MISTKAIKPALHKSLWIYAYLGKIDGKCFGDKRIGKAQVFCSLSLGDQHICKENIVLLKTNNVAVLPCLTANKKNNQK